MTPIAPTPIEHRGSSASNGQDLEAQPSTTPSSTVPTKKRKLSAQDEDIDRLPNQMEENQIAERVKTTEFIASTNRRLDTM